MKPEQWTEKFSEDLYREIADKNVYITNLAKCTQIDARPLKDNVFKDYLTYTLEEITLLEPKNIITLGNQVSSILLEKPIKVSDYKNKEYEELIINKKIYKVYPTFYPVGQGTRNMPAAIERIQKIST